MPTFAVTLTHGPRWDHGRAIREQDGWGEHAAFMDALVAAGRIVVGGPIGDLSETLHLVQADDEAELRTDFARDPWATAGLLEVGSVRPWLLWLDSRRL